MSRTLGDALAGQRNAIGFLRLCLASAVVISHAFPIGLGTVDPLLVYAGGQAHLGTVAVYGFFVLSGLLITQSAQRLGFVRFLWHRGLRILPGLWVCLLVTAFVIAPIAAWHERGSLANYFTADPDGPLAYVRNNGLIGVGQWGIQDVFVSTPMGQIDQSSQIAGPQWSLVYEVVGYLGLGLLGLLGILKGARRSVLFLTGALYLVLVRDAFRLVRHGSPHFDGGLSLPLLGNVAFHQIACLGFIFLLGSTFQLYRERIPLHDGLGLLSLITLIASLLWGASFNGFLILGLPAIAYLLVWLSLRLPARLHPVGVKADYSYGIYIYGFAIEQLLATFGAHRLTIWAFVPLSLAASTLAGFLSWHIVEKRAMRFKGLGSKKSHSNGEHHGGDDAVDDSPRPGAREQRRELLGAQT